MSDEVLVYATRTRADAVRAVLGAACQATGLSVRLELYGSGSLFQRLGPRHAPPLPDVVCWSGPLAAQAAAQADLLQAYQPARMAPAAAHEPGWRWTSLDYLAVTASGAPALARFDDLASAPRLALADPERSEAGLTLLLASLDRARQADGDPEHAWQWWQQRASALVLVEDEPQARRAIEDRRATHALGIGPGDPDPPLAGLAPIPNAVGIAASARNVDAARRLVDWLVGPDAAGSLRLSAWQASTNGLQQLLAAAPPLDVAWATQQYTAVRQRWSASGFGPSLT